VTVELGDGTVLKATVVGLAAGRDIAILRVSGSRTDWPALPFGDSTALRPGHQVFAIGNPTDLGISFHQGIISRQSQQLTPWLDHLQSDLQIHPGNSGGPLLDHRGQVVGMNTAIGGMGGRLAFSIPAADLRQALTEFRSEGALADGDFGGTLASVPGGPPFVVSVPGKLTKAADLRVGDTPLTVAGERVPGTGPAAARAVRAAFARKRPEESVRMTVRRAIEARVILPGDSESAPPRTAPALVINEDGLTFVPPGNAAFMTAAAAPGAEPKIQLGDAEYPVEVLQAGAFGILRVGGDAGVGTFEQVELCLQVERYGP
jgi:S1-C subfamily serine protease